MSPLTSWANFTSTVINFLILVSDSQLAWMEMKILLKTSPWKVKNSITSNNWLKAYHIAMEETELLDSIASVLGIIQKRLLEDHTNQWTMLTQLMVQHMLQESNKDKMMLLNNQTLPLKKLILSQSQCFQLAFQLELKVLKIRLLVLHALRKTQNQCAQETYFQLSKKERNKTASSGLPVKLWLLNKVLPNQE